MAKHDTNCIQAIMMNFCPCFDGKYKAQFLEYENRLRVVLSFYRQSVATILQGEPKPTAAQNSTAVASWERASENLFSILFFTTERSANNIVKRHISKTREDWVGNGEAARSALEEKYNSHTKEARRAYHEKLHSTKMKSGDDPDDFLYTMDGFRERLEDMTHITGTLTSLARALGMAVMLHYVWLTLGSFLYNRVASTNTNGQPETFGSTDAKDGLALAAVPAAEKWSRGSNSLFSVMVDSGLSGHYFDDALIPGLRYRLDNYHALAIWRWITTLGGNQLKEAGQGLPRGHSIGAQRLKRLTQLSVLAGPDAGRDLFSVKQDGAVSRGKSLSETSECGKPREQPASLREASPAGGAPQDGALEHPEQSMSSGCEHVKAPFARPLPLQHHGPLRHQVTPAATRAGNATQSIKERNDNDCTRLVEIATDSTLSHLRRLGLYTEAFLTDIAHQTDEAQSVVEYACTATNDQMYSVGEETEVVPNTFEEATITGSRWVYTINVEKPIGQPRLVGAYGAGTPVAIAARHPDLRPREVNFGERAGVDEDAEH